MAKKKVLTKRKSAKTNSSSGFIQGIGPFNLGMLSLGLGVVGQYFLFSRRLIAPGLLFFLLAIVVFIIADKARGIDELDFSDVKDGNRRLKSDKLLPSKKVEAAIFIGIILISIFFRVFIIQDVPAGCYRDEGQNGNEAINIMNGVELDGTKLPVYIERFTQNAAMYMYFIAASFKVFGIGVLQIRLVSVVLGVLSVGSFYFLIRYLFGIRAAIAGSFILAVLRWHVNFSRIGFLGISTVMLFIAVMYFAYRVYKERRTLDFIMLGFLTALSLYTYIAARLIPVGLGIFAAYILFREYVLKDMSFFKKNMRKIIIAVSIFIVVLAPLGVYVAKHMGEFMTRTSTVSIFNHEMLKAIGGPYVDKQGNVKGWPGLYLRNLGTTMLMFNYIGDGNPRHNFNTRPMLDIVTGILFIIGFGFMLFNVFKPQYFLYMGMFVSVLQAGLLSIESPQAYRTICVIPLVIIAAVLVLDRLVKFWEAQYGPQYKKFFLGALVLLLCYVGYKNYEEYFEGWAKDSGAWAEFSTDEYNMGRYLKNLGEDWVGVVLPSWYDSYTFRFATYPLNNFEKFDPGEWIPIKSKIQKNYVYILDASYLPIKSILEGMYPGGKYTDFRHKFGGRILYFTYEVPYAEVKRYQDKSVKNGLIAQYYKDDPVKDPKKLENHWKGAPVYNKIDPFILFNWTVDPIMGAFSVKWHGGLRIEKEGNYTFSTDSNDYSDLTIDGSKIISNPGGGGGLKGSEAAIRLSRGTHEITVRYYESVHYSKMQLWWKKPGSEETEVIPSEVLFPE